MINSISGLKYCKLVMVDVSQGFILDLASENDIQSDIIHIAIGCLQGLMDVLGLKRWGECLGAAEICSASVGNLFLTIARNTTDWSDRLAYVLAATSAGNLEAKRMASAALVDRLRYVQSVRPQRPRIGGAGTH